MQQDLAEILDFILAELHGYYPISGEDLLDQIGHHFYIFPRHDYQLLRVDTFKGDTPAVPG